VIALAARGSAVIVGSGETFIRKVIETKAGASLADQAGYKRAMQRATEQNSGQLYVGAPSVLGLIGSMAPAGAASDFRTNVQPYLEPLDVILETATFDQGGFRIRLVATVK
jgi:hypothetical protein